MDQCVRTSYLLVCAALWLKMIAGNVISLKAEQTDHITTAVGASLKLSCWFNYTSRANDQVFGKFFTWSEGENAGKRANVTCQPYVSWGQPTHCKLSATIKVSLNLTSSVFYCKASIPRLDGSVLVTGTGTNVSLYSEPKTISIKPQHLEEGKEATLECEARHFYPRCVTVRWLCRDRPAPSHSIQNKLEKEADGMFSLSSLYQFTPTADDHAMACHCQLHHLLWTQEAKYIVTLNVSHGPGAVHVTSHSGSMTNGTLWLPDGFPLNITCAASGSPSPEILWFWGATTKLQSGDVLVMASITKKQEGLYWCVAKNQYGQSNASVIVLVYPTTGTKSVVLYTLLSILIVTLLSVILGIGHVLRNQRKVQPNQGPIPESVTEGGQIPSQGLDELPCPVIESWGMAHLGQSDPHTDDESGVIYAEVIFPGMSRCPHAAQGELEDSSLYSKISPRKERRWHTSGQKEALHSVYVLAEWPSHCSYAGSFTSSRASSPSLLPLSSPHNY